MCLNIVARHHHAAYKALVWTDVATTGVIFVDQHLVIYRLQLVVYVMCAGLGHLAHITRTQRLVITVRTEFIFEVGHGQNKMAAKFKYAIRKKSYMTHFCQAKYIKKLPSYFLNEAM